MNDTNNSDPKDQELENRLSSLDERLKQRRGEAKTATSKSTSGLTGFGNALRLSSEFIAAILVGAGIGYLIDTFVGTTPWAMIVLLFLGFAAGVLNVLRASGEIADPYKSGWAAKPESTDQKSASKKASDEHYDDEDDW